MDLPGLQQTGLNDWPNWYRHSFPGHFVSDFSRAKATKTEKSEGKIGIRRMKGTIGVEKGANKAEQVLKKVKELDTSEKGNASNTTGGICREGSKKMEGNRSVARDTRDWDDDETTVHGGEDEDEDVSNASDGEGRTVLGRGKLVDV